MERGERQTTCVRECVYVCVCLCVRAFVHIAKLNTPKSFVDSSSAGFGDRMLISVRASKHPDIFSGCISISS